MEEARVELERENNMKNREGRNLNKREKDFMNDAEADGDGDGDVEEFEDEEDEKDEEGNRYERQLERNE
jgi:hypothetical protein